MEQVTNRIDFIEIWALFGIETVKELSGLNVLKTAIVPQKG